MCFLLLLLVFLKIRELSRWDDVEIESDGKNDLRVIICTLPCWGHSWLLGTFKKKILFLAADTEFLAPWGPGDTAPTQLPHQTGSLVLHVQEGHSE